MEKSTPNSRINKDSSSVFFTSLFYSPERMNQQSELCPELPAPPRRIFAFAASALALGVALALWIEQPRGPECYAILAARTTYVTAPIEGTFAEMSITEGADVKIGDPILRLQDGSLERRILDKKREIAALESQFQQALAATELELNWRTRTLESEICDIQLRSASFLKEQYSFDMQRSMLNDVLAGRDFVIQDENDSLFHTLIEAKTTNSSKRMATVLEMENAANGAEVSAAQVEICEERQKQLLNLKSSLPMQIRRTQGVNVAEANVVRAKAELDQLLAEESDLMILSPSIGRVGVFQCRTGDHLKRGTPIVELLDDAKRYLVVHVPSKEIPHFALGTNVKLKFPGNETRTGIVSTVSPQAKPSCPTNSVDIDTTILVHVDQTGNVWPSVPIGSQVQVRVSESD